MYPVLEHLLTGSDLRIRSIKADGVLNDFGYFVEFASASDDDRMRLIYAPNGRGKTNFLKAVSAVVQPSPESLQSLIEIPLAQLNIEFAAGGSIAVTRKKGVTGAFAATVRTPDARTPCRITVDPTDFAGRLYRRVWDDRDDYNAYATAVSRLSSGAIFIGDDRLAPPSDDAREAGRVESPNYPARRRQRTVSRLLETVERMLTQSAFASLSREREQAGIYAQITRTTLQGSQSITATAARTQLETQIERLLRDGSPLEKYRLLSMRQVREISGQISNARSNHSQFPALHRILTPYFASLEQQIESLAPAQELIDTYVTSVNRFLDRKRLEFTASDGIRLHGRDGRQLHPENLSSGERHLLLLLSNAILATAEGQLMIIDEPELSLGIEWQRDLLPELLRCSQSGAVQFLIASHSVQVMSSVDRSTIVRPSEAM